MNIYAKLIFKKRGMNDPSLIDMYIPDKSSSNRYLTVDAFRPPNYCNECCL